MIKSSGGIFSMALLNPFHSDCISILFRIFYIFIFNFQDLNMIAVPNSHLVLQKGTLKQHFEKKNHLNFLLKLLIWGPKMAL